MALTRGEQMTLFVLFQMLTSQFRLQMEGALGIPVDASPPGPPQSAADFHARLVGLAPLLGIARANLSSNQDSIYVGTSVSNQRAGISTDPNVIASALAMPYQSGNPCPGGSDQARVAVGIVAAIGA